MTINAAPNPDYESWCEMQPHGSEWDGDYIETLHVHDGRLCQSGGFTRYRGQFDFAEYGECIVDRDGWAASDVALRAAHFMA